MRLVEGGIKSDRCPGACATGTLLAFLGGTNAKIEFRQAGSWDVLRYGESVMQQLSITLLTFVGTVIAGIATYLSSTSDPTKAFVYGVADIVVLILFVLAALKLIDDVRTL